MVRLLFRTRFILWDRRCRNLSKCFSKRNLPAVIRSVFFGGVDELLALCSCVGLFSFGFGHELSLADLTRSRTCEVCCG
jgi:hypothetical protein